MTQEELINKYPKIFQNYEGNPDRCNWDVPNGWIQLVDDLCGSIQNYIDRMRRYDEKSKLWKHHEQVTCTQMKEKFGGLRFYCKNESEIIEGMIGYAEYLSENTCQSCGSRKDLGITSGWISVLCNDCKGDRKWKPLNQE